MRSPGNSECSQMKAVSHTSIAHGYIQVFLFFCAVATHMHTHTNSLTGLMGVLPHHSNITVPNSVFYPYNNKSSNNQSSVVTLGYLPHIMTEI